MQMNQAKTWVALIILIIAFSLVNGSYIREPLEDEVLSSTPALFDCVVSNKGEEYIGGNVCFNFPQTFTFDGPALLIKGSSIARIKLGDFTNLSHLESLTIEMNIKLEGIDEGVFFNMSALENLTITNNPQLMYVYPETFTGLVNLRHLVLSKNVFTSFYFISEAVRPGILPSLISLDASGNTFRFISYTDSYHMNSSTLEILKLSSCSINLIEGTTFNNLPKLRVLHVDNNNLETYNILNLISNISENSNQFSEIHIGANTIPDPNAILSQIGGTNISLVDFSFTRFALELGDYAYALPGVTYLDLSATRSRLPEVYFTPVMFPNLKYLFLASNYLLGRRFYMSLPKLRHLDLSDNVDSGVCDSVFGDGFDLENMTSLEVLRLDSNPISRLEQGSFQNLSRLKELYLVNTSIHSFGVAPFSGLDRLEVLDLSQNLFPDPLAINNTTFVGLHNLKTLVLENTMLTCLADDDTFTHTPKLQYLSLKHNTMLELRSHLLFPVQQLNFLDLSFNSFESWDQRLFEANQNLETLLLNHNVISTFTLAMLQDFSVLKTLDLTDNDFSCDCKDVSALFPYVSSDSANDENALIAAITQRRIYCSSPSDRRFSSLWKTVNELRNGNVCDYNLALILKIVILCAGIVIIMSIPTLYFLRWHIKYWIFLLRQAMSCWIFPKRKASVPQGKYLYDAFVSYSNADRGFVVRLVSMLENKSPRFRLCVFERDFAVGGVITDNVVGSLAKSKRTILVLSDAFARSTWCQWEMNLAQHKRLFFKDDQHGPLIIIKIGEIMEKHMTPTLRYLTKTRIYLQWNSDPIKQKVFWEKLRSALAAPLNDSDDDDRPALQHAVLRNGETVNNNRTVNISVNHTNKSIDV